MIDTEYQKIEKKLEFKSEMVICLRCFIKALPVPFSEWVGIV